MHESHESISRRRFLSGLTGCAATAFALGSNSASGGQATSPIFGPRQRKPNPFVTEDGKPILVCVEGKDFHVRLEAALEALGGLTKLIPADSNVLIKPNFNAAEVYPGISRVSSIKAIISEIRGLTSGIIRVGDVGYDPASVVYNYLNLYPEVESVGGVVSEFKESYRVRREEWSPLKPDFEVYASVYDAPIILNLCNIKRHRWARYTCAIKNNVGAVPAAVTTSTREHLHYDGEFKNDIIAIASFVNPELNIVDAKSILTKNGPFVAWGEPVEVNKLIVCGDMVATDAYCLRLLEQHDGFFKADTQANFLERASALGLGEMDLSKVEVLELTV
jgi:uncharacterized protein (DUF362 family)